MSDFAKVSMMESLPTELLAKIFDHLSDNDIFNLPSHIISHTLTETQAQDLLQPMRVLLEKGSLERLNRINQHPNLARHVQELRFYNERLENLTSKEYLESYWFTHQEDKHTRPSKNLSFNNYRKLALKRTPEKDSVAANFEKYRMQLEDLRKIEKQQDDVRLLKNAFRLLPNLETIAIDNMYSDGLRGLLGDAWCYDMEQDPLDRCGSHLLEVIFKAMSNSARKIPSFKIRYDARPTWYSSGMTNVNFPDIFAKLPPNTISSAVQSLRSLKLRSVYYGVEEIQFHDAAREKSCGYYWSRDYKVDEDEEYGTTKAIAEMLRSAPLLEKLTLIFYNDYREYRQLLLTPYIPLHSMRGSNDLQYLKRLSLGNFNTRQDQLVRFLLKVAGTITHIHIDGIVLDHGSWFLAFSRLRRKFPRLERFKIGFHDLYDAGLGVDGMHPEELFCSVKACYLKVCIADYETDPDTLLRWFRDGTGSIPISPTRRDYSEDSDDSGNSDNSD